MVLLGGGTVEGSRSLPVFPQRAYWGPCHRSSFPLLPSLPPLKWLPSERLCSLICPLPYHRPQGKAASWLWTWTLQPQIKTKVSSLHAGMPVYKDVKLTNTASKSVCLGWGLETDILGTTCKVLLYALTGIPWPIISYMGQEADDYALKPFSGRIIFGASTLPHMIILALLDAEHISRA